MLIRGETITYIIKKKKSKESYRNSLILQVTTLEDRISECNDLNVDDISTYNNHKQDLVQLNSEKVQGAIFCSKAQWVEHGEKNTKYFLNLEKHNYDVCHIRSLITVDNEHVNITKDVMNKLHRFYSNLYASNKKLTTDSFDRFKPDKILNSLDKEVLDCDIISDECKKALDELPKKQNTWY